MSRYPRSYETNFYRSSSYEDDCRNKREICGGYYRPKQYNQKAKVFASNEQNQNGKGSYNPMTYPFVSKPRNRMIDSSSRFTSQQEENVNYISEFGDFVSTSETQLYPNSSFHNNQSMETHQLYKNQYSTEHPRNLSSNLYPYYQSRHMIDQEDISSSYATGQQPYDNFNHPYSNSPSTLYENPHYQDTHYPYQEPIYDNPSHPYQKNKQSLNSSSYYQHPSSHPDSSNPYQTIPHYIESSHVLKKTASLDPHMSYISTSSLSSDSTPFVELQHPPNDYSRPYQNPPSYHPPSFYQDPPSYHTSTPSYHTSPPSSYHTSPPSSHSSFHDSQPYQDPPIPSKSGYPFPEPFPNSRPNLHYQQPPYHSYQLKQQQSYSPPQRLIQHSSDHSTHSISTYHKTIKSQTPESNTVITSSTSSLLSNHHSNCQLAPAIYSIATIPNIRPYYYEGIMSSIQHVSMFSFSMPKPLLSSSPILKGSSHFLRIKKQIETATDLQNYGSIEEACRRLQALAQSYPTCYISWLEYSRMEHIRGNILIACDALESGLQYLPNNESILEKKIKLDERLRSKAGVERCTLQLLHTRTKRGIHGGIDGIFTLAKMNELCYAQSLFTELVQSDFDLDTSSYLDYVRFIFKVYSYETGFECLQSLTHYYPSYSPLWFFILQVNEQICTLSWRGEKDNHRIVDALSKILSESTIYISDDLLWKICCNAAQALLRLYTQQRSYKRTHYSTLVIPSASPLYKDCLNLIYAALCKGNERYSWKIWILLAKICNAFGYRSYSRQCLLRVMQATPMSQYFSVIQEVAKIIESYGTYSLSVICYDQILQESPTEWKVALDRVFQLTRLKQYDDAINLCIHVIHLVPTCCRMWSTLIQLYHYKKGPIAAYPIFLTALYYLPKSGEIWCEGGRIFLNPCSSLFNVLNAQRCLCNAITFTPQYGDSYIEMIRLQMITSPLFLKIARSSQPLFIAYLLLSLSMRSVMIKCTFSDPNYGGCWFAAKSFPLSTAEEVLLSSIPLIAMTIATESDTYYDALLRLAKEKNVSLSSKAMKNPSDHNHQWMKRSYAKFAFAFPPLYLIQQNESLSIGKQLKFLFGTSQIES